MSYNYLKYDYTGELLHIEICKQIEEIEEADKFELMSDQDAQKYLDIIKEAEEKETGERYAI